MIVLFVRSCDDIYLYLMIEMVDALNENRQRLSKIHKNKAAKRQKNRNVISKTFALFATKQHALAVIHGCLVVANHVTLWRINPARMDLISLACFVMVISECNILYPATITIMQHFTDYYFFHYFIIE